MNQVAPTAVSSASLYRPVRAFRSALSNPLLRHDGEMMVRDLTRYPWSFGRRSAASMRGVRMAFMDWGGYPPDSSRAS